jgi:two-component system cell cycle response regulator DivK
VADAPTVLLVDNHEDSRHIYAAVLRHYGLDVVPADCTPLVLEIARARAPAVVVLELSLSASPSWQIAAALRAEPASARVPLVGLGSTGLPEHRARAFSLGCAAYLLKPVSPMELLTEVRRVLGDARTPG